MLLLSKVVSSIKPYSCHLCCRFFGHQHVVWMKLTPHPHARLFLTVKHSDVSFPRRSSQHIFWIVSSYPCSQPRICSFQTLPLKDHHPGSFYLEVLLIVAPTNIPETHMHTRPRHAVHVVHNGHQRQETCKHLPSGNNQRCAPSQTFFDKSSVQPEHSEPK
jgi:hypothetical protein